MRGTIGRALDACPSGLHHDQGNQGTQALSGSQTYYRDVKPIIDVKCNGCHVDGGIAPFALGTYEEVSAEMTAIEGAVESGIMPPWPPSDACASYLDDRSLTAGEIETIGAWVDAGGPAGDPNDEPVKVPDTSTTLSRVDRTLTMPAAY